MKKHSRYDQLERQVDHHVHRLQLERAYASQLDSDISRVSIDLTKRKSHLKASKSAGSNISIAKELTYSLIRSINQLDELVTENAKLRGRIDDMRLELKGERERIGQRKEEIDTMLEKAYRVRTERETAERNRDSYRSQIRSFSIDKGAEGLEKPKTAYSIRPRTKQTLSLFPPLLPDLHSNDVLQYLLASWEDKIRAKRQALIQHQNFIFTLKEGFAVMQKSDIRQITAEIIAWASKERSLRATLSTVQDSVTSVQGSLLACQSTIDSLVCEEKDRDWQSVQQLLAAAPLLAKSIRELGCPPTGDVKAWISLKVEEFSEEMKKKGTVEVISAQVIMDLLQAIWKTLKSLKPVLAEAGLSSVGTLIDREFSIDGLTRLIYDLELTFTRLEVLLRHRGLLPLRDNSQLSQKSTSRIRPATSEIAGQEVDHPLTFVEFRARVRDLVQGGQ